MSAIKTPMTSCRSYLIDAIYRWIVDNQHTPYLIVNANLPSVEVPLQFVQEGRIVLNIAPLAVKELSIESTAIRFTARFNNIVQQVFVPTPAVLGIYAKENGRGMFFDSPEFLEEAEEYAKSSENIFPETRIPIKKKPILTVIKNTQIPVKDKD